MKYTKPPLLISDQINLLESRGLIISDHKIAEKYLSNISYYRMSAYMYPFKNLKTDRFINGITFEQIVDLYLFDRELRLLIFDAIETIEIVFRTQLIYQPSIINGAYWFQDIANFDDSSRMNKHNYQLDAEIERSSEVFIEHFKQKYEEEKTPPVWMSFEVISLGLLSKFYHNLKLVVAQEREKSYTLFYGQTKMLSLSKRKSGS